MRIPVWLTLIAALAALVVVVVIGQYLIAPSRPLIIDAAFAPTTITPNADGSDDVTILSYELSRNARVSLTFTGEDGSVYGFRQDAARIPDHYSVAFSGVVDGFTLPGESFGEQEIVRRLIPDGTYTWSLTAVDDDGNSDEHGGTLVIENGDAALPLMPEFTVFPPTFTPNQDGIADRTYINVFLNKDANLTAYLIDATGQPIYLAEYQQDVLPNQYGRHLFDYDGGVDLNADPPPDGTYQVVAFARDAVGQEVQRIAELTIEQGGKPYAQIIPQPTGATVVFETRAWEDRFLTARDEPGDLIDSPDDPAALNMNDLSLTVGDLLVFKLTVENYGDVPIRTSGPEPGTVYEWDQRASTLGLPDEAGAWRVGIDCETAMSDYPWRWAIGDESVLETAYDPATGNTYRYLPAGARAVVWGAVRMTDLEAYNPQNCWAGLIHEQVGIDSLNNVVGARSVELVKP
ncbi:MAG: hypothetical protein IT319_20330 [Anaerolineae bacterium]|nr:hypothetical protein [Anaerolineae bacterium]